MAASNTFYNSFRKYSMDGTFDLDTDTFRGTLHTSAYTPSATAHTVYADLTNELATANGYTNGGLTLTSVTWTQTVSTVTFTFATPTWTASGAGLTARYFVIRKLGTANGRVDPLIGWILMDTTPADVVVAAGNPLSLGFASGMFVIS